ncbi:MAG: uroporphyrinogen decarboxylase family protein [Desulfomonilia bacterium]|nr:uroporphyrinogen decarboxylase family protein [Desulfomonilia bacterium]
MRKIGEPLLQGMIPPPGLLPERLLDALSGLCSLRGKVSRLTNVERLITTLWHREPDRVPCCPLVISGSRRLIGASFPDFALKPETTARALMAAFDLIGGEVVIPMLDLSVEASDFGQTMIYPENSTPHPDYDHPLITDHFGYRKLKRIKLTDARRMHSLVEVLRIVTRQVGMKGVVSGFCFGPLGVLCMMRGAEHLFRECILYPTEVMSALETITGVLAEFIEAQCETGVAAITLDTLFASRNGLSKPLWEQMEGPFVRELSSLIRSKGCIVGVHNCGHGSYFDSQIRFMEPQIMSFAELPDGCDTLGELKKRYGDQVVLMGNMNTSLLAHAGPYEVIQDAKRLIEALADGGGFVLAPGCEYPPNAPLENAFVLAQAAKLCT